MKSLSHSSAFLPISVKAAIIVVVVMSLAACAKPLPGPDKQFAGSLEGAVTGAGAGAVTGFQVGAGTGPGAAVGAGLGAVAGGIRGAVQDRTEEQMMVLSNQTRREREVAFVHEVLQDHYQRRIELHPTRDIYPADLFFYGDEVKLRPEGLAIVRELSKMNKTRVPWSRLAVVAYVRSSDEDSQFARYLAEGRSKSIADKLILHGLEPRRVVAEGVVTQGPLLLDPNDSPTRYNQAIELVPLDR